MAGSFNKVILMGHLTRDPVLSYTPQQTPVVEFGMATNRVWTGQDGQKKDETCYISCKAFGRMAENINKFFHKGKPIFIEGRLKFESWTTDAQEKRSRLRVMVENFQFVPADHGPTADPNVEDTEEPCTEL